MKVYLSLLPLTLLVWINPAKAQIIPDGSVGTIVTPNGISSDRIDGGALSGNNLFHSFSEFNINSGRGVYFNPTLDVTNIFTRVTGANPSNINGTLGVLGNANLFFLNPNGIIFGTDARLDLKGSFLATTANSIGFANGETFSSNLASVPTGVLSVNPNALLFNQITTQPIINRSQADGVGLQVPQNRNLLLVGSDVLLEGGRLQAPGGRVELTAVAKQANLGLVVDGSNLRLSSVPEVALSNISLTNAARVNVRGITGGSIVFNAQNVNLIEGSTLLGGVSSPGSPQSQAGDIDINAVSTINLNASGFSNSVRPAGIGNTGNINIKTNSLSVVNGAYLSAASFGKGNAGNVNIQANTVSFDGQDSNGNPSLASAALGSTAFGKAGNINVNANSIKVTQGAFLFTATQGQGSGGNININAGTVLFDGVGRDGSSSFASSAVNPTAIGNAGNINITADSFSITNGGFVSTSTLGKGNGGNLSIRANLVSIDGVGTNGSSSFASSAVVPGAVGNGGTINITGDLINVTNGAFVTTSTLGQGNGGSIFLNANTLNIVNGGGVETATYGNGNAGNLIVNAKDSIFIAGIDSTFYERLATYNDPTIVGASEKSGLYSSTSVDSTGQGGLLQITTGKLLLEDKGQVTVSSQGTGNAGNLIIAANSILLTNGASIKAESQSGSQGNIIINADDIKLLNNSNITTNATGAATGGNITINAGAIAQLNNSNITASASEARGGNILIQTQGLFKSTDSNIEATGSLDGEIKIMTPDIKQDNSLKQQSSEIIATEQVIASSCLARKNSTQGSFAVTGNGGLPKVPSNDSDMEYSIAQVRGVNISVANNPHAVTQGTWKLGDKIQEARQLVTTDNGRLLLTTSNTKLNAAESLVCNMN
ncbi:filamentous hemagglutinin outer membrane protein [Calothrix sp. NIES-4071]|nr:filamentous hemagglutinin outer membrane protein [Calothrix sp. NIES-4071]BAZ64129.1 filamentous hemagglutinin outer membrane protein [Calothrix sp. NIES-4105]